VFDPTTATTTTTTTTTTTPTTTTQTSTDTTTTNDTPRTRSHSRSSIDKESQGFLSRKFGTQLVLTENPITSLLWDQDVIVVAMNKVDDKTEPATRKLEIFLDYLLSLATSTTAFLLNPKYDALLNEPQKALRNSLVQFVESLSNGAREAQEFQLVKHLLDELGWQSKEDRATEEEK